MNPGQKKKSYRVERMNDLFREAIASFMISGVKSSDLGFVTIPRVSATPDLQLARVYFTVIGASGKTTENEITEATRAMRGFGGKIRRHLAQELNLRHTPELEFFYDEELEKAYRLEKIFYDLERTKPKAETKTEEDDND